MLLTMYNKLIYCIIIFFLITRKAQGKTKKINKDIPKLHNACCIELKSHDSVFHAMHNIIHFIILFYYDIYYYILNYFL